MGRLTFIPLRNKGGASILVNRRRKASRHQNSRISDTFDKESIELPTLDTRPTISDLKKPIKNKPVMDSVISKMDNLKIGLPPQKKKKKKPISFDI